jgi:hypothetical protein
MLTTALRRLSIWPFREECSKRTAPATGWGSHPATALVLTLPDTFLYSRETAVRTQPYEGASEPPITTLKMKRYHDDAGPHSHHPESCHVTSFKPLHWYEHPLLPTTSVTIFSLQHMPKVFCTWLWDRKMSTIRNSLDFCPCNCDAPITVAARSKAWTVFARLSAGIVGSNFTQGMDVCVRLFCVCAVLCR